MPASSSSPLPPSFATDCYALGLVIFEMLTGCRPWPALNQPHMIVGALIRGEVLDPDRHPPTQNAGAPSPAQYAALRRLCLEAQSRQPGARPTVPQLLSQLQLLG